MTEMRRLNSETEMLRLNAETEPLRLDAGAECNNRNAYDWNAKKESWSRKTWGRNAMIERYDRNACCAPPP